LRDFETAEIAAEQEGLVKERKKLAQ